MFAYIPVTNTRGSKTLGISFNEMTDDRKTLGSFWKGTG